MDPRILQRATELALDNVRLSKGGPFGAVIVKDGSIIAEAVNLVTMNNDPTAHAEVLAIREACRLLQTFQLTGAELYTSCEPCPMCLGAIYWARLDRVYYAATQADAAEAGFDDSFIYREIAVAPASRAIPMIHHPIREAGYPFAEWKSNPGRVAY